MKWYDKVLFICAILSLILFGMAIQIGVTEFMNKRAIEGFYLKYDLSPNQIYEYAQTKDDRGDWVCINVAYGMTPKRAFEVCTHECTHRAYSEILAEKCETDFEGCMKNLFKEWDEE